MVAWCKLLSNSSRKQIWVFIFRNQRCVKETCGVVTSRLQTWCLGFDLRLGCWNFSHRCIQRLSALSVLETWIHAPIRHCTTVIRISSWLWDRHFCIVLRRSRDRLKVRKLSWPRFFVVLPRPSERYWDSRGLAWNRPRSLPFSSFIIHALMWLKCVF
jgi:hypothetical protein